jgi:hypothetical protein
MRSSSSPDFHRAWAASSRASSTGSLTTTRSASQSPFKTERISIASLRFRAGNPVAHGVLDAMIPQKPRTGYGSDTGRSKEPMRLHY